MKKIYKLVKDAKGHFKLTPTGEYDYTRTPPGWPFQGVQQEYKTVNITNDYISYTKSSYE